jgi:hypothetical protein
MPITATNAPLLIDRINKVILEQEASINKLAPTIFSGEYNKESSQDFIRGVSSMPTPSLIGVSGTSGIVNAVSPHTLTITSDKYGSSYRIGESFEYWDSRKEDVAAMMAKGFLRSWVDLEETIAANVLNLGFTTGASGGTKVLEATTSIALFSASHTQRDGSTVSNTGTAALSLDALQTAVIAAQYAKDYDGRPWISMGGVTLHVGTALSMLATRIVGSTMDPNTANNSTNPIKKNGVSPYNGFVTGVVVNPRITGSNWFLLPTDKSDRAIMKVKDFDTGIVYDRTKAGDNGDHIFDRRAHMDVFVSQWQNTYGSDA